MQLTPGTTDVGGRPHYQHYQPGADGNPPPSGVVILLEDDQQGITFSTAYAAGTRCRLYQPIDGEEMNILCVGGTGTGSVNVITEGQRLTIQNATGQFIPQATAANLAYFQAREKTTLTPDVPGLVFAVRTAA